MGLFNLCQLGVGLSKLKFHKFNPISRIILTQCTLRASNDIDAAENFLLLCPSFDEPQLGLAAVIVDILQPLGQICQTRFLRNFCYVMMKRVIMTSELTLQFIHKNWSV